MTQSTPFTWPNNCRAAVSLTYDDGLSTHRSEVVPLLERLGLRGTFNLNIESSGAAPLDSPSDVMQNHMAWRAVAEPGHELGNHSLFHPCRRKDGAGWPLPDYDLRTYTPHRWFAEMHTANFILQLIDGRTQRTFGNTCCNTTLGDGDDEQSLSPLIEKLFVAARGPCCSQIADPLAVDLTAIGHFNGDRQTFADLRDIVEQARDSGGWAVLMFHGVGDAEHRLHVNQHEHAQFVDWLAGQRDAIWTAPMLDAALHVNHHRDKR